MRQVTCQITKEKGLDIDFYKASNGKYYKSKEIYQKYKEEIHCKNEICKLIYSFYSKGIIVHNVKYIPHSEYLYILKKIGNIEIPLKNVNNMLIEKSDYYRSIFEGELSDISSIAKINIVIGDILKTLSQPIYAGCYQIANKRTGEKYIGETVNIFNRFTQHISDLYSNNHHCKRLQDAFNKTKDIKDFIFEPLYIFPVMSVDKNEIKHETLYLEAAFYLNERQKQHLLYNTQNPYVALKQGIVSIDGYSIDCSKVLTLMHQDKYNVMSYELHKIIYKDLKAKHLSSSNINIPQSRSANLKQDKIPAPMVYSNDTIVRQIKNTQCLLKQGVQLYRITQLLQECATENIIPPNYDYNAIRNLLQKHNLIYFDDNNRTLATQWALDNGFYCIEKFVQSKNGDISYRYYITGAGKNYITSIFQSLTDKEKASIFSIKIEENSIQNKGETNIENNTK